MPLCGAHEAHEAVAGAVGGGVGAAFGFAPFGAEGGGEGVAAFYLKVYFGDAELVGAGDGVCIKLRAADDPGARGAAGKLQGFVKGGGALGAVGCPAAAAREDDVLPSGQGAKARRKAVPGAAAHDDGAAGGGAFEVGEVFGQVPGEGAAASDDAPVRLGPDEAKAREGELGLFTHGLRVVVSIAGFCE